MNTSPSIPHADQPAPPKASLVICTRNRASRLDRFLASLERLDLNNSEIVFVNNGSEDATGEILRKWASEHERVRILDEPRKGLGRARNTGWRATLGDIVVFTDDDCYPAADYIQEHVKLYVEAPHLGWVSGRILLHDPKDARITIQENDFTVSHPSGRFLDPGAVHGANMSFRRSALEAIDGFDPLMGAGALFTCEDLDAAARVLFKGFEGLYSPAPVVEHHHGRQTKAEVEALERLYRIGRGSYYGKCLWTPSMRRPYLRSILGKWLRSPLRDLAVEAKALWDWRRITWSLARSPAKADPGPPLDPNSGNRSRFSE